MGRYLRLLRNHPFAALWTGSTVSAFGDSLTWVALLWLVYSLSGSTRSVSALVVVATAPVIVGGFVMGAALDRFDRRRFLAVVNTLLGLAVVSVPLASWAGLLTVWQLYVVAALYGLLKMANWAGVPSIVPSLVHGAEDLATANAMESVSFGLADVAGPAVAGALIALIGAAAVLGVDAATYAVFVGFLLSIHVPAVADAEERTRGLGLRPALRFLRTEPPVLATTLMFMSFNVGEGILLVLVPVYARQVLGAGSATFGLMLSAFAFAALVGASVVGAVGWRWPLGRSIAAAQTLGGLSFLGLAALPQLPLALATLVLAGLLVSPLTIWAQTIRMQLIPETMRGRVFGVLRTLMQSTVPIGGALAGVLLPHAGVPGTVVVMVAFMAIPGAWGLVTTALAPEEISPAAAR